MMLTLQEPRTVYAFWARVPEQLATGRRPRKRRKDAKPVREPDGSWDCPFATPADAAAQIPDRPLIVRNTSSQLLAIYRAGGEAWFP